MSSKPDSKAGRDQDLDETIERQLNTTGLTGVMQTLWSDAASEGAENVADEPDEELVDTIVIPPVEQALED